MSSLCASKSKIILTQKNWRSWYFRDLLFLPAFHLPIRSFGKPPQNSGKVITSVDQLLFSWEMSQIFAAAADSCHLRGCPGCQEGWRSSEPQPVCATLQTWWHRSVNRHQVKVLKVHLVRNVPPNCWRWRKGFEASTLSTLPGVFPSSSPWLETNQYTFFQP